MYIKKEGLYKLNFKKCSFFEKRLFSRNRSVLFKILSSNWHNKEISYFLILSHFFQMFTFMYSLKLSGNFSSFLKFSEGMEIKHLEQMG